MSPESQSRGAKARPGFIRRDWRKRVDRAFTTYWLLKKRNQLFPRIKDEKRSKQLFDGWLREFAAASRSLKEATERLKNPVAGRIQEAVLRPLAWESPPRTDLPSTANGDTGIGYPENPEASFLFRTLVFLKYGVTFSELIRQIDVDKSDSAHRKVMTVHRLYWRVLNGTCLPQDLKLKFSRDHFDIITQGFDFGLAQLTPEELAECLDEICPCEQRHSPEYLKKLRTRIRQACQRIT